MSLFGSTFLWFQFLKLKTPVCTAQISILFFKVQHTESSVFCQPQAGSLSHYRSPVSLSFCYLLVHCYGVVSLLKY